MKDILRNTKRKPGLTLIEVIISVALLAILSVPIFITVNTNVKMSQKTELSQQATVVGQRVLEYLGTVGNIELEDSSVLKPLGLDLSSSKDIESGLISTVGKTKQGFNLSIDLRNLIENELEDSHDSITNDLMKSPQFTITEAEGNQLSVNQLTSDLWTLIIEDSNVVKLCSNVQCVTTPYQDYISISINGCVTETYEVPVVNHNNSGVKIYVQFDANATKNVKFKKESGDLSVSYLTKMPDILLDEDESMIESIKDLYEINVTITTPKVDGMLFKGNTVTNLNIYELGQGGE